ncbi:MAG: hypothetical protein QXP95_08500 [Candidatus Nezhaarchaeales archaeon]
MKASRGLLVKAYSIPHNLEVSELVEDYMRILNAILEDLWRNMTWKREGKRLIRVGLTFKSVERLTRIESLSN